MKKSFLGFVLALLSFAAFAGTPVYSSIYLALGAGRATYFENIKALEESIKSTGFSEGDFDIEKMDFYLGIVEGDEVTYQYYYTNRVDGNECELMARFTVIPLEGEILSQTSTYKCTPVED